MDEAMNAVLLGAVAALCWGVHDLLIRYVARSLGSLQSVFIVFVSGAACLLAATWLRGQPVHIDYSNFWVVALAGVTYALAFIFLFKAFEIGPVSLVSPIVGAYPMLAIGWAVYNGRQPSALDWLALAGIIAGVMLVARFAAEAPPEPGRNPVGTRTMAIIYALLSCVGFAFTLTAGQVAAQDGGGELNITLVQRFWGIATLAPLCLRDPKSFAGARQWFAVLILMGALDVLALTLVISAGKQPGAEYATVVASCFGAVTVVLAVIFFKERLTKLQLAGMLMILGGVVTLSGRY
jgi:drug/metabolite transporter (DMT)-like permease